MSFEKVVAILSRLVFLVLALAVLVYAVAMIVSAVSFYRTTQKINADDVRVLEELTIKLDKVLEKEGTLAAAQAPIVQKNEELKAAIMGLRQANTQPALVSNLDTISANLSFLSEILKNERGKADEAVSQLTSKVAELKKKVGPPDAWDKIAATFLRDGSGVLAVIIWPALLLTILLYLLKARSAPERLKLLLKPFKSLKLFEAELVLSDEAKVMAESTFENYRKQAIENCDLFVQRKMLKEKFENVVNDVVKIVSDKTGQGVEGYRCTLHVPDLVFADTLYQLLDYLPKGSGRGRIFSVRFGLIGRVWRSGKSEARKFDLIMLDGRQVVDQNHLIRQWGMSRREAQTAAEGRPSFLCVVLTTTEGDHVGVFYMDSNKETTFDVTIDATLVTDEAKKQARETKEKEMLEEIATKCRDRKIVEILAKMNEELGGRAPLIRIYEK